MKLQIVITDEKTKEPTIADLSVNPSNLVIQGATWSIALVKEGLATKVVVENGSENTEVYLEEPSYKEVRAKVKNVGRTPLSQLERSIFDGIWKANL